MVCIYTLVRRTAQISGNSGIVRFCIIGKSEPLLVKIVTAARFIWIDKLWFFKIYEAIFLDSYEAEAAGMVEV